MGRALCNPLIPPKSIGFRKPTAGNSISADDSVRRLCHSPRRMPGCGTTIEFSGASGIPPRRLKPYYLALEGLNAVAVALYYNYLFFFMQMRFGFGDLENLGVSALNGLLYTYTAWQGGRLGQRWGYLQAVTVGIVIMAGALVFGAVLNAHPALSRPALWQIGVMVIWTAGVSLTWPSLEALVSDHEPPRCLPRMVGIYNVTWASGWALAYFVGGAMLDILGLQSLFVVPVLIHGVQLVLILRLRPLTQQAATYRDPVETAPSQPEPAHAHAPERTRFFLWLAWIANPFSFMAISALVPLIPGLARRHDLTPTLAGAFCSIWFFARLGTFILLWHWPAWHYRFRWFIGAFVLLIVSYAGILVAPSLWPIFIFQVGFGIATGLIYYSSLYYSMDAGDAKSEHGGIHEAGIGAGNFCGPAIGGLALLLFPRVPQVDTWAVSSALSIGLIGLVAASRRAAAVLRRNGR
jgi:MFS family permease